MFSISKKFLVVLAVLFVNSLLYADVSGVYEKKATWAETMVATRDNYQQSQDETSVSFGSWYYTKPMKGSNFKQTHISPDKAVDLKAKNKAGKRLWAKKDFADGSVHSIKGITSGSTYLYRVITAKKSTVIETSLGSDDGIEVWLNGKKVHSKDVPRGLGPNQDKVNLKLKSGKNQLLMKIYNRTGSHGFYFSAGKSNTAVLMDKFERDFPVETAYLKTDMRAGNVLEYIVSGDGRKSAKRLLEKAAGGPGQFSDELKSKADGATDRELLEMYVKAFGVREMMREFDSVDIVALRRAIEDLVETWGSEYKDGKSYLLSLAKIESAIKNGKVDDTVISEAVELKRKALMANPLLDFDEMLLIKRNARGPSLGLPANWQGNCSLPRSGYDDQIAVMKINNRGAEVKTLFKPEKARLIADIDLHFDAGKRLFSMQGSHNRHQIWEVNADGNGARQVTTGEIDDIDNYDACYLPDGRVIFASTRAFHGVPCVTGNDYVANLCIMDADGSNVRQLCFDQDHNWCPTVLNNGRVMYTRWEYSDSSHYFTRILFQMNPDGTNQGEYYGSNSYWPNSIFYARPIPGDPTKFVSIVSGHHGVKRMGELVLFDPSKGRHEADGVIQRMPGYGEKVEPIIMDRLVDNSWPKFLHPYPLSEKYFIVSSQPTPKSNWGVYLVDVFDNMLLLKEKPGFALFEPTPLRKRVTPPVIPDRVDLDSREATVYIADIYVGQGLEGVPRGTVKKLRVYELHYAYPKMGGHKHVAIEGTWDVRRVIGTVDVYEDGSAMFKVPANTPLAVQPLDAEGKAVQIMRSWFTAMPGETLSCVGCHERQNTTPAPKATIASVTSPAEIKPWYGPTRGFSFKREIQPVLDKHCVSCHNADHEKLPDLAAKPKNGWGGFTPSYIELHPFVRRPGPESDYHVEKPMEYHADTSELVQMLTKGHHDVKLSDEDWDKLITWIDLNVPDHGTWSEHRNIASNYHKRRMDMRLQYANRPEDPETIVAATALSTSFALPKKPGAKVDKKVSVPTIDNWPLQSRQAVKLQADAAKQTRKSIDFGDGNKIDMVLIPAGKFVMGSAAGPDDQRPLAPVAIEKSFWMSTLEITNELYKQFDGEHESGFINQQHKDHTRPGYPANMPNQPVIRISWNEAIAFCDWLSVKTGLKVTLPTEAQWEYACRAGSGSLFWYGDLDTDFGAIGNMADVSMKKLAVRGVDPHPVPNPSRYEAFLPMDDRYSDAQPIVSAVGLYKPNPWGLKDMHGNVAEWTLTDYKPYPYSADDGRNSMSQADKKVARGGSWYDRPKRSTSAYRVAYEPWQGVFNVGFRVVCQVKE